MSLRPTSRKSSFTPGRLLLGATLLAGSALAGCGPVYVHERPYYGTGYYAPSTPPAAPPASPAASTVAGDPYFGDLGAHGRWVNTAEYGLVWIPYAAATTGWRPYYYGRWEYTAYGWTWVSSESWASTYHYGRWTWMSGYNWVWIPGYTWAPSWVTWRHGGGCVGWAPMGPDYVVGSSVTVHYSYWIFVPETYVVGYPVQTVVITPTQVPKVYDQSVVIYSQAQIRGHDGRPVYYDRGPNAKEAEGWTRQPIREQPIDAMPAARPRPIPADAPAPSRPARPARPVDPTPEPRPTRPATPSDPSPESPPTRPATPDGPAPEPRPTRPATPSDPTPEPRPTRPATPVPDGPDPAPTRPTVPSDPAPEPRPARPVQPAPEPEPRPTRPVDPPAPTRPTAPTPSRPTMPTPTPTPSRPAPVPTRPSVPTPAPAPSRPSAPPKARDPGPKQRAPASPMPTAPRPSGAPARR